MEEINSKTVNVNNRKIATENMSTKRIFMGEKKNQVFFEIYWLANCYRSFLRFQISRKIVLGLVFRS